MSSNRFTQILGDQGRLDEGVEEERPRDTRTMEQRTRDAQESAQSVPRGTPTATEFIRRSEVERQLAGLEQQRLLAAQQRAMAGALGGLAQSLGGSIQQPGIVQAPPRTGKRWQEEFFEEALKPKKRKRFRDRLKERK